jgi:opacity protein-like surface antigen
MNRKQLVLTVSLSGILTVCAATVQAQELFTKPAWLQELSLGVKESYDDNIFGVSGVGLQPKSSWISAVSPKIAFNFAPLLGSQSAFQSLSLSYAPDLVRFHEAPTENYDAHKIGAGIRGTAGDFSFSLDDAFLYNDGSKIAPTYALNQTGAAGELDKYRNVFATAMPRERRNQVQERETAALQYDWDRAFIRGTDSLLDYNLDTAWHNSTKVPYIGYQNYVDRSDVNGGLDLGYKVATNVAVTLGYRYGSQFQQQFPTSITTDSHYSSSTYQRVLLGVEGKPFDWLDVKLDGGPDFRDYNSHAPVTDFHPTKYYGEAAVKAMIATNQSLTFNYKQWTWVFAAGEVPEFDSSYALNYHWNVTGQLGFDLGARIQEADFTGGNDTAGTAPSDRADRLYTLSSGVTYAITPRITASLNYTYDAGNNEMSNENLPAAARQTDYRNFSHNLVSLGLLYKF